MRVVMAEVPATLLASRRRTGVDRWDEVWEGVLHMPPMPNRAHQDLEGALETWLRRFWSGPRGNKVYHQINLATPGGWPERNYRIPDLVLLTPDRFHIDRNEYFEGPPAAVVEIRSPNDETYEKLAFYHELGVPEVWVVDRDTRLPEIHLWADAGYTRKEPDENGWIASATTGIELRAAGAEQLAIRMAGDESSEQALPERDG